MPESSTSRYAVPLDELESGSRVPSTLQVESVDAGRGATSTSSDERAAMRWMTDGGGDSLGGAVAEGDGD